MFANVAGPDFYNMRVHNQRSNLLEEAAVNAISGKKADGIYLLTEDTWGINVFGFVAVKTAKVTGRKLTIKNLGVVDPERADKLREAEAAGANGEEAPGADAEPPAEPAESGKAKKGRK